MSAAHDVTSAPESVEVAMSASETSETPSTSAEERRAAEMIEAAPVDEGTKLVVRIVSDRMTEQAKINAAGHAETRDAIDRFADRLIGFAKQAGIAVGLAFTGAFVIIVLVIVILAQTRGVDVGETAQGVRGVTSATKELAQPGAPVAPSGD
jgi:hypothetical protein